MNRKISFFAVVLFFLGVGILVAQSADLFKQADDLEWDGRYQEEKDVLLASLGKYSDNVNLAEINWRLARAVLSDGEAEYLAKRLNVDQVLKVYEEGERFADKAIALNPQNPWGYFWKSANMGLWGQTKGVIDSLFKVGPMHDNLRIALKYDPGCSDAFYVLGELFEKAPGWPLSFGNVEYSVSLGRKAVDMMEQEVAAGTRRARIYVFYIGLSSHLWSRNWDLNRRNNTQADLRRQFGERGDYVEKHFFYEGTVPVKNMTDRKEAREIIAFVINELEAIPNRNAGQNKDLLKARDLLATFK